MRGSDTCELIFEDCEVPAKNVLREIDGGVNALMSGLVYERAALAAWPVGIMQADMDVALAATCASAREFGEAIGDVELVQGKIADMDTTPSAWRADVDAVRLRPRRDHARGCGRRHSLCRGEGHPMRARRHPVPRRQRLHQRLPDRAAAARRQTLRDRRRHQRNPPHADRPRAVREDRLVPPFLRG